MPIFNISIQHYKLDILARAGRQGSQRFGVRFGKEKTKLFLLEHDMTINIEKKSTHEL